ncbi:PrsW family intramembrane metalloprotease [Micromonospora mirobrigensis]|uniref:Membrane proteinase PrsW, cleaves anti-sigma factor RsiW, M82 family n=1 Tax=Micromonospora mirobrigensis TaxID=262898 RepID=A0A1C4WCM8_9ACTN|nr:PrsW family glutamic-type intramembrane protease [Micromonospora mirobrigensis]SCE93950.1 Membrane proteinase PrsW, cleaves anti-sigma factor RsiW, M82 family [Micromonospora mirobrigensis]
MDRTTLSARHRPRRQWLRMFLVGLALWLATVVIIFVTGNPNLIPTLVLLGSFLVPVTFVAWAFGRRDTGEIDAGLVFGTFITGGVLGVLAASVLESYLLRPSAWLFVGVGLIEEAAKLAALALLTRHLAHKSIRDGMILGAAVGFGFAAFESAGYAFTALFTVNGLSLIQVVQTEILRGLLAPVGHGLWTAILGGVLFAPSTRTHFKLGWRLLLTFLGVSLLHALWDSMHSIALYLTLIFTEGESYRSTPNGWLVSPSAAQLRLLPTLEWSGMALVSLVGLGWLLLEWRAGRRRPPRDTGWRVPTGAPTTLG